MMAPDNFIKPFFYFGYSLVFAFAALKITHTSINYSKEIAIAGSIAVIIFMALALIEIYRSRNIMLTEKIMWTVGFLFFNLVTGIIYFFFARNRVLRNYKLRSPFNY